MISGFRPMLSAKLPCFDKEDRTPTQEEVLLDLQRMDWSRGFFCSPKLDGIRAVVHPDLGLVTRTLKEIPNRFIYGSLSRGIFHWLDGEVISGGVTDQINFNTTQSVVMTREGKPEFTYAVFDHFERYDYRFDKRLDDAHTLVDRINKTVDTSKAGFKVMVLPQKHVHSPEELLEYEEATVLEGYEGIMIRDPGCRYKFNRSTYKQQGLIKIKRFIDAEAVIIDFEELQRNTNEPTKDAFGLQRRSAHKAGQVSAGTLGKLVVRAINGRFEGEEFKIGSGFDFATRDRVWGDREAYLGTHVKFKYQDAGSLRKPRAPIFLGFRDKRDM